MGSGRPLHDATAAARSYGTSQVHMKRGDYWKPGRFVQRAGCGLARRTTASGFVAHVVEGEQNRAGTPGSPGRESLKAAGVPLLFRARCETVIVAAGRCGQLWRVVTFVPSKLRFGASSRRSRNRLAARQLPVAG
jgi:hypothetical protein